MKTVEKLKGRLFELTGIDVDSKDRKRETVYVRALLYKYLMENTNLNDEQLQKALGKSRTMLLHYKQNILPEVENYRKDLMDVYQSLLLDVSINDLKDIKIKNLEDQVESLKGKLQIIKDMEQHFSIIDLKKILRDLKI